MMKLKYNSGVAYDRSICGARGATCAFFYAPTK